MFYNIRKTKHYNNISELSNLRTNIYNKRVSNNVAKQFEEVHGRYFKPVLNQNQISGEEGLNRAYDSPNRYYHHRNKLFIAGTTDPQDFVDDMKLPGGTH